MAEENHPDEERIHVGIWIVSLRVTVLQLIGVVPDRINEPSVLKRRQLYQLMRKGLFGVRDDSRMIRIVDYQVLLSDFTSATAILAAFAAARF